MGVWDAVVVNDPLISSPEAFFGHAMGSDRRLERWDRIVAYFELLCHQSERIRVESVGPSTEGHPFIVAFISSPSNLARLDSLRSINARLHDPRGLSSCEIDTLISDGRAVVLQTMSMHSNEIGGTQMAPELAFDLVAGRSEETMRILENVLFIMVPCFNPDGQIMITDWYNRWISTPYEGSALPWLYAKYSGHDNNRDAYQLNLVESRYVARIAFREWQPQLFLDHHHQRPAGARLFIPPYANPVHPYADPLTWAEMYWYGGHMFQRLQSAEKPGVITGATFPAWANTSAHYRLSVYHNTVGMHTESASARLASPRYVNREELKGNDPNTPHISSLYTEQPNRPKPWGGGYWHLRDIVEQQKIAAWAVLDLAARHKEDVLRNCCVKAGRQAARGKPGAFIIPFETQHDPSTARRLLSLLMEQGIELHVAESDFANGEVTYPKGTYVVFLEQPKMGLIRTLLGRGRYPDNYWTRFADGRPFASDSCTDCMPEFMGVTVVETSGMLHGQFSITRNAPQASMPVAQAEVGWVLDPRMNDTYSVVNLLLAKGVPIWRLKDAIDVGDALVPSGAFYVASGSAANPCEWEVPAYAMKPECAGHMLRVLPLRVGVFQRYWGGNPDEGWTRFVLESFGFDYVTMRDSDVVTGMLTDKIDVLILPSDTKQMMLGPDLLTHLPTVDGCPPEYRSGMGLDGAKSIAEYVKRGGTLVTFGEAGQLAIDLLGLKVRDVTQGLGSTQYFTHGSTLRVHVDVTSPLGYGMPAESFVCSWDSPVYEILEQAAEHQTVVAYGTGDILGSGWLIGAEHVRGKSAMVRLRVGKGEVILYGFSPQFRGQTCGTFKLLFNSLYRLEAT